MDGKRHSVSVASPDSSLFCRNPGVHGAGGDQVHVLHHSHRHVEPRVTRPVSQAGSKDFTKMLLQCSHLHAGLGGNIALLGWQPRQDSEEDSEGKIYHQDQGL